MSGLEFYLTLLGMALIAFALRYGPMAMLGRAHLPPGLQQALRYVPAATLAGLVFPALLAPGGRWALGPHNEHLLAGLAAAWVAWRYRNALLTILVGMGALWLLRGMGL
ncbi:Branched-chain amino acid transport protein (AzlD) [Meiothermus luteus]|uniref:Branched-chain amino acid transport protein (AzlD) n=1 Tax=Meiothermus luteus TaxID=2026184 RepID=A0A399ELP6_9DEIN|nr:AzlD domain-containing protein [Meiothermus luteus]RIH85547.1 Branched-chain amino acid transport protein (AzlD) [Meiothermus luteus]